MMNLDTTVFFNRGLHFLSNFSVLRLQTLFLVHCYGKQIGKIFTLLFANKRKLRFALMGYFIQRNIKLLIYALLNLGK